MTESTISIKKKENQLFKVQVPINIIWDFLNKNFEEKDSQIKITKILYKTCEYNNTISPFMLSLRDYYYSSKKKYVDRTMNYNYFLTIIRQLCNANNIKYDTKLIYDKSSYEIEYTITKA
jgi:hypothetical protein